LQLLLPRDDPETLNRGPRTMNQTTKWPEPCVQHALNIPASGWNRGYVFHVLLTLNGMFKREKHDLNILDFLEAHFCSKNRWCCTQRTCADKRSQLSNIAMIDDNDNNNNTTTQCDETKATNIFRKSIHIDMDNHRRNFQIISWEYRWSSMFHFYAMYVGSPQVTTECFPKKLHEQPSKLHMCSRWGQIEVFQAATKEAGAANQRKNEIQRLFFIELS
jgi:hypothetical protein